MSNSEQELHIAVRKQDKDTVDRLLQRGVNINCLYYGWTPLQMSIDIGNQDMATFLIDSGCDIEFHDKNNKSPFEDAVLKKQAQVVEAMMKKKIGGDVTMANGETPLTHAVIVDCPKLLEILLQGGVDANLCNKHNQPPLFLAARDGNLDLVKALLLAGADVNFASNETGGCTPLIAAAASEHKAVVFFLIKHPGCNINAQDKDGWTALWHAYSNGSDDICAVLLRAGADKRIVNADGVSVVEDAKNNEDEDMVELFKKFNNFM